MVKPTIDIFIFFSFADHTQPFASDAHLQRGNSPTASASRKFLYISVAKRQPKEKQTICFQVCAALDGTERNGQGRNGMGWEWNRRPI